MLRIAALLALLTAPVPTTAEPHHTKGELDGVSFDYTAKLERNENLVLRGTYVDTGAHFSFTVTPSGHVAGWIDNNWVTFDVAPQLRDRAVAELRANDTLALAADAAPR
jgi:hypothetical protein